MKKMLFAILVAMFGFTGAAYAQFTTGTVVLGGGFSFSKGDSEFFGPYYTQTSRQIAPRIGVFVANDIEIGVQPSYTYAFLESNEEYFQDQSTDMIMLAPYGRKYFSLNEWAGFYLQGGIGFGWGRIGGSELSESKQRSKTVVAGIAPGVTIRLGKRVGIDFQATLLEYQQRTFGIKDNYADTKSDPVEKYTIGPNFSKLSLGINFFL